MSAIQQISKLDAAAIETVLLKGDLSKLTEPQRLAYYQTLCESVGLNPLTQPFQYLSLSGKLVLYARKDCTDQLRSIHGVSVEKLEHKSEDGLFVVTANVRDVKGRCDAAIGATSIENLKGEAKANAMMKAETKAKRRATLSICGLGMLDETEIDSIPGAIPAEAIAADGKVGPKCEDCKGAIGDWKGEIRGRQFKYTLGQIQTIARKLYDLDLCGDCLKKRGEIKETKQIEAGADDCELVTTDEGEHFAKGTVNQILKNAKLPLNFRIGKLMFQCWHKNTLVPAIREAEGKVIEVEFSLKDDYRAVERIVFIDGKEFASLYIQDAETAHA